MSKLYMVRITVRAVVVADNFTHALNVVRDYKSDICRDALDPSYNVCGVVNEIDDISHGWDAESAPYGGDGISTVAELLTAAKTEGAER